MPSNMPETGPYDSRYYESLREGGSRSAEAVLPRVLDLVGPESIVDFGCGDGTWLAAATRLGATDVQGVDGGWVSAETLQIPKSRFRAVDLASPLDLGRRFDLAFCLEVAEHLPASAAPELVRTLTSHAPVVLFSGAIPFQGGEDHINEAWPSHWRSLFEAQGFACLDMLRGTIWEDPEVELWYRQNLLLFASCAHVSAHSDLAVADLTPLDVVHPSMFLAAVSEKTRHATELERLGHAYEDQAAEIAVLQAESERLCAACTALDRQLACLRRSLSWRLTSPIRAIGRRFGV